MPILNTATLSSSAVDENGNKVLVTNDSNVLRTDNVDNDIIITKSAVKDWVVSGEIIELKTTILNNSSIPLSDVKIKSTIGSGASFVVGSFKIGSIEHPDLNIEEGCVLPVTIGALGGEMDISYKLQIEKYLEVDSISDISTMTFTSDEGDLTVNSNVLNFNVMNNQIVLLKSSDHSIVKSGDELTYTIKITNEGNLKNTDLVFTDPIPDGTIFVEGSVKIDGADFPTYNPQDGFVLDDLNVGDVRTISFKIMIK